MSNFLNHNVDIFIKLSYWVGLISAVAHLEITVAFGGSEGHPHREESVGGTAGTEVQGAGGGWGVQEGDGPHQGTVTPEENGKTITNN